MRTRLSLGLTLLAATLALPAMAEGDRFGDMMMKRMDTDGDGQISQAEFQPPHQDRHAEADANGDGAVTLEEFNAMGESRRAEHEARMTERFTSMDSDGDGAVTAEEARLHAFSRMDKNKDGVLSRNELKRPEGHGKKMRGKGERGGEHPDHEE